MGGVEVQLHHSWPRHQTDVSSAHAASPPSTHRTGRWVRPGTGLDIVEKINISCLCLEPKPDSSAMQPVARQMNCPSSTLDKPLLEEELRHAHVIKTRSWPYVPHSVCSRKQESHICMHMRRRICCFLAALHFTTRHSVGIIWLSCRDECSLHVTRLPYVWTLPCGWMRPES
jgi:hypothetical protein